MLANAQMKKGVIVINGYARRNPARRPEQASTTLRVASENYRYALLTGTQLFDMVRSAKDDPSEENLRALRETIMNAEGPLPGAQVTVESIDPAEAGAVPDAGVTE
jgi:hypothetical protein